jgi:putative lipoic acid-binding regulatory protein
MEYTVQVCPSEVSASIDDEDVLTVSRTTPNAFNDRILVIRATSNGKHVDMEVSVSGVEVVITVDIADFEDVELSPSGIWEPQEGNNEMFSHGWTFTNYYSSYFWGGFTASNRTDLSQTYISAQYTAATGCGYDGSVQYAVAYTYGAQTDVYAADGQSHTVTGCYVTNNLWAYQNMLEGDNTVTPFGGISGNDPDWFKLTATGKNASGQTVGTLDFYLADYRFDNPEDDYILNTWEWFDLSPLGEVATISFDLSSSKNNNSGMITPAYFCMDDFNGGAVIDLPPYIVTPIPDVVMDEFPKIVYIDLNGAATDPDDPDELIEYSMLSNSNEEALSATMSGRILMLERLTEEQAEADIAMRATSDGQYVDFNIHVVMHQVEGVEEDYYGFLVYPNPTEGRLTLTMEGASGFDYHVFSLMGQCIMNGKVTGNETTLDLSHLNKGVYYISIEWNGNRLIKKVIVK